MRRYGILSGLMTGLAVCLALRLAYLRDENAEPHSKALPSVAPSAPASASAWYPEKSTTVVRTRLFMFEECPYMFQCTELSCDISSDSDGENWYDCLHKGAYKDLSRVADTMLKGLK